MTLAQSAAEAFEKYTAALSADLLVQSSWHKEIDGRQLACGLGVLGDEITSASKCPAQIMPRWLAQMVPWFFDNQEFDDAKAWGLRFYSELKRLDGKVPFSVVYDWQSNFVCQLGVDAAVKHNRDPGPHKALADMHGKALAGEKFSADEWKAVLKPAYAYADADANAYAYADADADANAYAYAYANANAYAYAYANANAYAYAYANANANADAYAYAYANANAKRRVAIKRLADGMVTCLQRVAI